MAFAGGWICRSCWSSNRGSDARCYRCKTERGADDATVTVSRTARNVEEARREMQQARVPALVALWPSIVFGIYAWLEFIGAVLLAILTVLVALSPSAARDPMALPILIGVIVALVLFGMAMRWVSRGMRRSNPWAFAVGLVLSLLAAGSSLVALTVLPPEMRTDWTIYADLLIFGPAAILALIGLLYSLTGADEVPPPTPESPESA